MTFRFPARVGLLIGGADSLVIKAVVPTTSGRLSQMIHQDPAEPRLLQSMLCTVSSSLLSMSMREPAAEDGEAPVAPVRRSYLGIAGLLPRLSALATRQLRQFWVAGEY